MVPGELRKIFLSMLKSQLSCGAYHMAVKHILWFVIMIIAGLCSTPLWLLKMAIQRLVKTTDPG